jgi:nicotinamidase/pyrazinamidase
MNILVLVDMQNDFINGSLGVGHEKWDEAFGKLKVAYDRLNPDMIVVTKDMHPADHCSFKEQNGPWPAHCVEGTGGADLDWRVSDMLQEYAKTKYVDVIYKGQNKAEEEYGVDILGRLDEKATEIVNKAIDAGETINLYFTGLCYDYCVYNCAKETATANSVLKLPQTLTIVKDATVAIDPAAEPDMQTYAIRVVTSADGDLVL